MIVARSAARGLVLSTTTERPAANLRISVNGVSGLPNQPVTFTGLNTYSGDTDVSGSLIFAISSPQT